MHCIAGRAAVLWKELAVKLSVQRYRRFTCRVQQQCAEQNRTQQRRRTHNTGFTMDVMILSVEMR